MAATSKTSVYMAIYLVQYQPPPILFIRKFMNPAKELLNTLFLLSLVFQNCVSLDIITPNQPIKDGQILVSNKKTFALGFFKLGNSYHRYVGIWYHQITEQTVVWVANKDNPLNDTSGVLSINGQGNLVLHTQNQTIPIWSTNVSFSVLSTNNYVAKLLDVGNLVLIQQERQHVAWQSFDYPTENWSAPQEFCDKYSSCGPNSYCKPYNGVKFECTCLPGFEPKSSHDWSLRDWSGGCLRKKQGVSICNDGEGFVKVEHLKVSNTSIAHVNMSLSLKECEQECLKNCSCIAYASTDERAERIGCLTWHGELVDTRIYLDARQDLYIRVDAVTRAEYAKKNGLTRKKRMLAILGIFVAVLFLLLVSVMRKEIRNSLYSYSTDSTLPYFEDSPSRRDLDGTRRNSNLPLFDLRIIIAATDNFSITNKLGEGGFGPIYKGLLQNGMEIAVKRLSKCSRQGIEQFKTEVALIAKLQHRNLVRILGCCIHENEKMLIYEYLPNKSLNSFIFDETKRSCLDWGKRFEIICGIARGILYLHQDSRLRVIHRDLKASNVLLDNALNPKISDFGMARIVGGDQIEVNTNCVVGTYGYMSPEYAMQGIFSIKSDVYSFGVLLLEIVTGKKNSICDHDGPSSNLIGNVWDLWREDNAIKMVDQSLDETYPGNEVSRCIQIGLLCVQEHATDRPTMSTVVFMLANDTPLPSPKQPAFIVKGTYNGSNKLTSEASNSINEITLSRINGR